MQIIGTPLWLKNSISLFKQFHEQAPKLSTEDECSLCRVEHISIVLLRYSTQGQQRPSDCWFEPSCTLIANVNHCLGIWTDTAWVCWRPGFQTSLWDILRGKHVKYPHSSIHDGYLFQGTQLCLPATSMHKHVVRGLHVGGCSGHLGHMIRPWNSLEIDTVRPIYIQTLQKLELYRVRQPISDQKKNRACINHNQSHMLHGKISACPSFWVLLKTAPKVTRYSWWLINFQRWLISYLVRLQLQ